MRILIVEDSVRMCRVLQAGLGEEGYVVECAHDGPAGLAMASGGDFDLMLLDLGLPGMDGIELLKKLRASSAGGADLPVIILSARDSLEERVEGLDVGADDYLVKDFQFEELLARVRAVTRRPGARRETVLRYGDLSLDPARRQAFRGTRALALSAREYALLHMFLRHPGRVLSRSRLYESVWDVEYDALSNVLDVYVGHLRQKLEEGGEPRVLHTVRGHGYRLGD